MKKLIFIIALFVSSYGFSQINPNNPSTFNNGIKLPNVTVKNTDSLATINGNGEIHYVSKNDVDSWILKVDGVNKKELKLGQALDIIAGDNVTLSYSNGTVTISAAGKEYTAGSGLTLIGSEFNADFGITAGTVTEGNDTRVVHGEEAYLWGDHATQGYLTSFTETDPIYSASTASSITNVDVANWDGKAEIADIPTDNAQLANGAGYLTSFTEADPVYSASTASGITAANVANWDGKAEVSDIPTDNIQLANGSHYVAEDKLGFGLSMTNDSLVSGERFDISGINFIAYPSNDSSPGFLMAKNQPYFSISSDISKAIFGPRNNYSEIRITKAEGGNTAIVLQDYSADGEETSGIVIDAGSPARDIRITSDEFSLGSADNSISSNITYGLSLDSNNSIDFNAPEIKAYINIAEIESAGIYSIVTKQYSDLNRLTARTFSSLPVNPSVGDQCLVTDAATPSWNSIVTGGGSTTCVVYFNGTDWIAH